ncbi:MAG: T9SS type A sorting domain-containing protein, partial [Bacteroidota bacterium]
FTKQGTPIWVAWNDSSVTTTIKISGISSNRVKTIEAVPKYESGKDVTDYTTAFRKDTLVVTNSSVILTLGQSPLFVETLTVTSVEEKSNNIPQEYIMYQNYPNPFNPSTTIRYLLSVSSQVILKIYDLLGSEVATLVNEFQVAGIHNLTFNIHNYSLPSGVYFYQLSAGGNIQTKKMILIK